MKITVIGGGPGGLFFASLMKRADAGHEITVYERNPANATFGFGVVFSDRTLDYLAAADSWIYEALTANSVRWDDIEIRYRGTVLRAEGNGFAAIARMRLLELLQERARQFGVHLRFDTEMAEDALPPGSDLIVAADGVNSRIRQRFAETFAPRIDMGAARFVWFGTTRPFDALTFDFVENGDGQFGLHGYPYADGLGTFLVECDEATWRRAGFDRGEGDSLPPGASDGHALRYCEETFGACLRGHRLLGNASTWRSFPTLRNARWHHDNIVLIGDAAHTAHFSVGSGTKMAMEDAMALAGALEDHGGDVGRALPAYEEKRRPEVEHIQGAAEPSQHWWEHFGRRMFMEPEQFAFHFLSRTGLAGENAIRIRSPILMKRIDRWHAGRAGAKTRQRVPPLSTPLTVRGIEFLNRIAIPPRGMPPPDREGIPKDWHRLQMAGNGICGAGLVLTGPVAASQAGLADGAVAGFWNDAHAEAWRSIVGAVRTHSSARTGLQLGWYGEGSTDSRAPGPNQLNDAFIAGADRAGTAEFDVLVLDLQCGSAPGRALFASGNQPHRDVLDLIAAVRGIWTGPLGAFVTMPGEDITERRQNLRRAEVGLRGLAEAGCDLLGIAPSRTPTRPHERPAVEQFLMADILRNEAGVVTLMMGGLASNDDAGTQVLAGRTDLCAGLPLLGVSAWLALPTDPWTDERR